MNRQRKVVITITYNEMGIIIDTKAEELDLSAQPEPAECIQDTKVVPDDRDMVCLSERVSATYYDDEHEEWSQKTVTIRDVLDSVCDEYTVLPSAQPQYEELTPEEAASEIASGSTMSAWYWLDDMMRLKQMGYSICRKR